MAKGSSSQTTTVQLSPEQRQLLNMAMPHLQQFADSPPQLPGYSQVAPFNPTQLAGQQQILQGAGQQQQAADSALQSQQFLLGDVLDPSKNPGLQGHLDAAARPIQQTLTQQVLPNVRSEATSAGQYGGSRQGIAEGLASQAASQAIGDTTAKILSDSYGQGLDAMVKALGLSPSVQQMQVQPGVSMTAVGDTQQQLAQSLLSEQYQNDMYYQMLPLLIGSELAGLVGGIPGGSTTTTSSGGGGSPIMSALGLGTSLLGGILGFL